MGLNEKRRAEMIEVWNKADLLPPDRRAALSQLAERRPGAVLVSAATGEGLDRLLSAIDNRLAEHGEVLEIDFAAEEGAEIAWVYDHAEVLERRVLDGGSARLTARFAPDNLALARRRFGDRLKLPAVARRAAAE
jgi:GTP-binding protein HflX